MSENKKPVQSLNKEAKEYIPTKNRKLNFNLDAKEYKPKEKEKEKNIELEQEDDEEVDKKMDMIVNDMIENELMEEANNNDSDEEDENKCYSKYKDCKCCKGYIYKCNGETCKSLGQCYCKMSDDCEFENNNK